MNVLFKTIVGSHLYGLAHENSDQDYFTVIENRPRHNQRARYAKQKVYENGEDSLVTDFSTWLLYAAKGVPQYLEAMFSEQATTDTVSSFRKSYHAGSNALVVYKRTIDNFIAAGDYKRRRHALRLALNAHDLGRYGRFNPTLSPNEVDFVSDIAAKDAEIVYAYCTNIALDRLPPDLIR